MGEVICCFVVALVLSVYFMIMPPVVSYICNLKVGSVVCSDLNIYNFSHLFYSFKGLNRLP